MNKIVSALVVSLVSTTMVFAASVEAPAKKGVENRGRERDKQVDKDGKEIKSYKGLKGDALKAAIRAEEEAKFKKAVGEQQQNQAVEGRPTTREQIAADVKSDKSLNENSKAEGRSRVAQEASASEVDAAKVTAAKKAVRELTTARSGSSTQENNDMRAAVRLTALDAIDALKGTKGGADKIDELVKMLAKADTSGLEEGSVGQTSKQNDHIDGLAGNRPVDAKGATTLSVRERLALQMMIAEEALVGEIKGEKAIEEFLSGTSGEAHSYLESGEKLARILAEARASVDPKLTGTARKIAIAKATRLALKTNNKELTDKAIDEAAKELADKNCFMGKAVNAAVGAAA